MSVPYERVNMITDQRGFVLELLSAGDFGFQRNAHVVVSLPGVVRGNHYHIKGRETITILGPSLAFAGMPRAPARGRMARGDRGVALRAKPGGFGAVPLGVAPEAPRSRAGSFTGTLS